MNVETVIGAAAKAAGVRVAVLCGPTREAKVSTYRWSAMVILRDQGLSSTVIARLLGRRDHSTVLHACSSAGEIAAKAKAGAMLKSSERRKLQALAEVAALLPEPDDGDALVRRAARSLRLLGRSCSDQAALMEVRPDLYRSSQTLVERLLEKASEALATSTALDVHTNKAENKGPRDDANRPEL